MNYSFIIWFAIVTECIFLIGEVPTAGFLYQNGFSLDMLSRPLFWIFLITRLLGISGQVYLWSEIQLGFMAALMGAFSLIVKNFFGYYFLGQPPLSLSGYIAVALICISLVLLTK